jgi:hypothetical protein
MASEAAPPRVFISYSHDSPEHKGWVKGLATKLRENGVDAILDQWNLAYGEDVPHFMTRSVQEADRVLMICTPAYVRKANDGQGGVGYEAMIVTGELVKDQGTAKFVPVVRELGDPPVPTFLYTRRYVDLTASAIPDDVLQDLLRELHGVRGLSQPKLGNNPFAELKVAHGAQDTSILDHGELDDSYATSVRVVRANDIHEWRASIRRIQKKVRESQAIWLRAAESNRPRRKEDLLDFTLGFVALYEPMFAASVAAVASGDERFRNQLSVLDEVLYPHDWPANGPTTIVVGAPKGAAFVFQALYGAVCLETGQLELAKSLAFTRIETGNRGLKVPLLRSSDLVGYSDAFAGDPELAWKTLGALSQRWSWVGDVFDGADGFRAAVLAYYLFLSLMDLLTKLAEGKEPGPPPLDTLGVSTIPPMHVFEDRHIHRKAYSTLMRDPEKVRKVIASFGAKPEELEDTWSIWMERITSRAPGMWHSDLQWSGVPHADLIKDLMGSGKP